MYVSAGGTLLYKLENGILTVHCDGVMPDFAPGTSPWYGEASKITAVIIEENVTNIGAYAFYGCKNLSEVTMGNRIVVIGSNAFADCENLSTVLYYGSATEWTSLKMVSESGNTHLFRISFTNGYSGACGDEATWQYDPASGTLTISGKGPMWDWHQGTYENNTPWNKFQDEIKKLVIGYGITATGRYAFCNLSALEKLEFITDSDGFTTVETIGGYGFCRDNSLETLVLPEGVRFISGRAFSRVESLKTVYLPRTLESVDMYSFYSADNNTRIETVYYNGTQADWKNVYVSTQHVNGDTNFLPQDGAHWFYLMEYACYEDVPANSTAWYKDAVYYLKDHRMVPDGSSFGVNEAAKLDWVLQVLYVRAGSSGAYCNALDWAKAQNIVDADATESILVSIKFLADILYRTTLYNDHPVNLENGTALDWCQRYISAELTEIEVNMPLPRGQAASILAAYLESDNAFASRYDRICDEIKTVYKAGGNGKLYILALYHGGTGKVGDSTLILMPGGEVMLIDTFRSDGWENYLKATLDKLEITNLDYLVLSHGHSDHDANLANVIDYIYANGYTIRNYWSAGSTNKTGNEDIAIEKLEQLGGVTIQKKLRAGERMTIGSGSCSVTVDILWPMQSGVGYYGSETNNGSLTTKLSYGESSYLCCGDLFMSGELDVLEMYRDNPEILKADVLKTNHHGSYSSNHKNWVAAVDPKIMITHSDDSGDSAQCYQYSLDGRAWFSSGRDGGVLVIMGAYQNIDIITGCDTNLRQYFSNTD